MSFQPLTKFTIEDLPTVIFQIIQGFLPGEDYRSLMDCNKKTFSGVKYETIHNHYTIVASKGAFPDDTQLELYYNLVNKKVKDKSKQIYIDHRIASDTQLLRYVSCFQGICYLSLNGNNHSSTDFDFNIFKGIRHVKLYQFEGIEDILSGFENVKVLELESFPELRSIRNINTTASLESFTVKYCRELDCLSFSMDNIDRFSVLSCDDLDYRTILSKMPKLKTLKMGLDRADEIYFNFPINLSLLTSLNCRCSFPMDFEDFHLFETISDLHLEDLTDAKPCFDLSRFMGHRLSLLDFDITTSIEAMTRFPQSFDNLRVAEFRDGGGIVHFPKLQHLKELTLLYCDDLQTIPTLPKLRSLWIECCHNLVSISADQPALKECFLYDCSKVSDLSFAAKYMRELDVQCCDNIRDVSMLGKVKSLTIVGCSEVKSLAGLEGDPFSSEPDQREISLHWLPKVEDFTPLHHIGKLMLVDFPNLRDCQGIHHIGHLHISDCSNLITTAGLGQIDRILEIRPCDALNELSAVERIPLVLLSGKEINSLVNTLNVLEFRTELMATAYGLNENWKKKTWFNLTPVKLFALTSMIQEMKSQRWVKNIEAIGKD